MRLPEDIIRDSIDEQQNRGRTLTLNAAEIVEALKAEGWTLIGPPEWRSAPSAHPWFHQTEYSLNIVVDDSIVRTAYIATQEFLDNAVDAKGFVKKTLAFDMARELAMKLGILS